MRFGICTAIENAAQAAAIGFDFVEVHAGNLAAMNEADFAAFCTANAEAPIHAEVANCLFPGEIRLTGADVDWAVVEAHAEKVMARLGKANIPVVVFGSGGSRRIPEGFSREEAWQQLIKTGRILGEAAAKYGVTVAVEPLRPVESNVLNTQTEGYRLVQDVNHPHFKLLCDLYHLVQAGGKPENAAIGGEALRHIHIAKPDDRKTMYPGDGADYAAFFEALRSVGYDGRVSFEGDAGDWDKNLPAALEVMKNA